MTPEQKNAIAGLLGADLSTLGESRLIEYCLLHRAQPGALETFPAALQAEINRRFTAPKIRSSHIYYSVLQNFANQFQSPIPLMAQKLREMAATVNRDIWFTDNEVLFKQAINDKDVMGWLVKQPDILEKCLHNARALGWMAQSTVAATAILTDGDALVLWKNTPNLWPAWAQHEAGMQVVLKSAELTAYLFATPAAKEALFASADALGWVLAAPFGQAEITKPDNLKAVVASDTARTAFIAKNDWWQGVREALYRSISASGSGWKMHKRVFGSYNVWNPNSSNSSRLFLEPQGLVFGCFGVTSGSYSNPNWDITVKHPGEKIAHQGRNGKLVTPSTLAEVSVVTFNKFSVDMRSYEDHLCLELWTPA